MLASVLDERRQADWNIKEMSNRIFDGGAAAVAIIRFDGLFLRDVVKCISESDEVFALSVNKI